MKWNGSSWLCSADATGGVPGDASYVTKGIVQFDTDAATSGIFVAGGIAKLSNTGVGAATYGTASKVASLAVNAQGRITLASELIISIPTTQITATGAATGDVLKWNGSAWLPSASSAVTSVTASAPLSSSSGATPNLTLSQANTSTNGYLSSTDWNNFNNKLGTGQSFSGDVSGTYNSTIVDKIKSSPIVLSAPAAGNFLKYNGTAWMNTGLVVSDIPNLDASKITTGTLLVSQGGTGVGSFAANKVVITNGAGTALQALSTCTLNQVLVFDASGNAACGNASQTGAIINGGNSFAANATIGTNDAYAMGFKTNNTTRMTVDVSGNVGIGTTLPSGSLDVRGGTAASAANGTNITLQSQNAGAGNQNGGNILLLPGANTGTGVPGSVSVGNATPPTYMNPNSLYVENTLYANVGIQAGATLSFGNSTNSIQSDTTLGFMSLVVSSTERMRMTTTGIGIGMSSPGHTLSVQSPSQNAIVNLYGISAATDYGVLEATSAGGAIAAGQPRPLSLQPNGGNVGIGTSAPTAPLQVSTTAITGNIATFTSTGVGGAGCSIAWNGTSCSSDLRLKENVVPLTNTLNDILKLQGVSFTWKKDPEKAKNIGFIAQEIEKVFPELVKEDTNGYKQVNYSVLVSVLSQAIKEFYLKWSRDSESLHQENGRLREKIEFQEKELIRLKEKVDRIDKTLSSDSGNNGLSKSK